MYTFFILYFLISILQIDQPASYAQRIEPDIQRKMLHKEYPEEKYGLLIYYPEVFNERQEIEFELSLEIQRVMGQAITQFQSEVQKEDLTVADSLSMLFLDYQVSLQSHGFLSLHFESQYYFASRHRKETYKEGICYDFAQQRVITLPDLFAGRENWQKELKRLAEQAGGACGEIANDQIFYLEDGFLVLIFPALNNKLQCKPFVRVPLAQFRSMLNPEFAAHPFFGR